MWVRNPFTGAITYFTDVHKKQSGFRCAGARAARRPAAGLAGGGGGAPAPSSKRRGATARSVRATRTLTTEEVLRVRAGEVPRAAPTDPPWLIRAFRNLYPAHPRVAAPAVATSRTSSSRTRATSPTEPAHHDELLYTGAAAAAAVPRPPAADIAVARLAYAQSGRARGADPQEPGPRVGRLAAAPAQPGDRRRQPVPAASLQEARAARAEPELWQRDPRLRRATRASSSPSATAAISYFCPFGVFPRSYEVVCPDVDGSASPSCRASASTPSPRCCTRPCRSSARCRSTTRSTTGRACRCTRTSARATSRTRTSAAR